ncbi:hypothetical protein Ga0074812_101155 [Parafrankia irregularis]|uniref:Uncharacterized protein n=1 Tax=Parafrankia irregularis TaxID=795642 RepID=A0A0S4QEL3_9ACTN|nr:MULTISPECIES: hypothetical protein [Parafrankia]MBE3199674.1 hypothetical protein [Parafrankia sp. CH37]CUU53657.1 hypothetical protein Ga0074812_101155 [Parafrankia irregularis]
MDVDDTATLRAAAAMALDYAASVDDRGVAPDAVALRGLAAFDEPLPEVGEAAEATLRLLHDVGSPATMATAGARYFGFVNGATLPVALGASWLVSAWDQNSALPVMSPVAAKLHDVARRWLVEILGLPTGTGVAFVTGMRVSVSSWKTDIQESAMAAAIILECAARVRASAASARNTAQVTEDSAEGHGA